MTASDGSSAPAVRTEPFALLLPAHLAFRVETPVLGADFDRGMIIEVGGVSAEEGTITLHIRRNRRTVTVSAQAFMLAWCKKALHCLEDLYRDPLSLPGFASAYRTLQASEQERGVQRLKEKACREVEILKQAAKDAEKDLQSTRHFLQQAQDGQLNAPFDLGLEVTVCWNCISPLFDRDYRCPVCRWRVCPYCGSCAKGGGKTIGTYNGPISCRNYHPKAELYINLRRFYTLDIMIAAYKHSLPHLESKSKEAHQAALRAEHDFLARYTVKR